MAQRGSKKKTKGSGAAKAPAPAGLSEAVQRLEARLRAAERERDGLKSELDAARTKISTLEERHTQVANRINWVIDSLRTAMEGGQ